MSLPNPLDMDRDERVGRMHTALTRGRIDDLRILMSSDRELLAAYEEKHESAIFHAASKNQAAVILLLAEMGADVNAPFQGVSPFEEALASHASGSVAALAALGVDVNVVREDGSTALYFAANWDDFETCEALLRAGADVNARDHSGATPLDIAENRSDRVDQQGRAKVLEVLVAYGGKHGIGLRGWRSR